MALQAVISRTLGDADTAGSLEQFRSSQPLDIDTGDFRSLGSVTPYRNGEVPDVRCPTTPDQASGNAAYCPADGVLSYDLDWMRKLYAQVGDAAPITILAHEWGHHIARMSGTPVLSIRSELQADCYAGVYVRSLVRGGQASRRSLHREHAPVPGHRRRPGFRRGLPPGLDEDVHGTALQRRQAEGIGYSGADLAKCVAYRARAQEPPLPIGGDVVLQLPPGVVVTRIATGEQVLEMPGAEVRIEAYRPQPQGFTATELLAGWPDRMPGLIARDSLADSLLGKMGWASGSGERWGYARAGNGGSAVTGVAELRTDATGAARLLIAESDDGTILGADSALAALYWGYCDRDAADTGNCANVAAPGPTARPGPTPSPPPSDGLTRAERALMRHIPKTIIDTSTCRPTDTTKRAKGSRASINCLPGSGVTRVWYESFPSKAAMLRFYRHMVGTSSTSKRCPTPGGEGTWVYTARNQVVAGRQGCYQQNGNAFMVWTENKNRIVTTAVQSKVNWKAFQRWWRLRAGPV